MLENEKILVTGVTGAIALPVALMLAPHNEVWGVARFNDESAKKTLDEAGVKTVPLDLADGALSKDGLSSLPDDFTLVLHYAYARKQSGEFNEAIELNAISAGRVLQHCQKARAALVLSAATLYSCREDPYYAYSEDDDIGFVSAPWAASSPVSKVTLEAVARFSAQAFDLPVTIARPACPYGTPFDVMTVVMDAVLADQPVFVANEPQPYSLIHIDDMCAQVESLLDAASVPATIVNWASDEIITTQEMATMTGAIAGVEPRFQVIPAANIALGGVLDTTRIRSIAGPCQHGFHDSFEAICRERMAQQK